jgi:hypothetical protein
MLTLGAVDCYATGDGTPPPLQDLYFPVGLQVSAGGTVLYVVNSDFDLQYNGGTLQSYDLGLIRQNTLDLIADARSPNVPILDREQLPPNRCTPDEPASARSFQALGETCAPPVRSSVYVRDAAVIGALSTDLLLSRPPSRLALESVRPASEPVICPTPALGAPAASCPPFGARRFDRLFSTVRGTASLTWASVERDGPDSLAPHDGKTPYGPFFLQCGRDSDSRCDGAHTSGSDSDEPGNDRHITMPGEPFGMAMSDDGTAIVVTHQNETKTSLFSTGLDRSDGDSPSGDGAPLPALKFVLDGVSFGGIGIASVPHDRDAFLPGQAFPRASYLQTSRALAEVNLLRQYPDELAGTGGSTPPRPFLDREVVFPIAIGAGGTDSRGIAIDPTPRILCKSKVLPADPAKGRLPADVDRDYFACGRKPARVFIANRSPPALLVGELGGTANANDPYDPDRLTLHTSVPLSAGPTKVYLAPVVESDGSYALRVFVVCFDSATVFVYDPESEQLENVIRVGLGPFAMAFDPFTFEDVAVHAQVPFDPRDQGRGLRRYRFAYLASFTQSFLQVLDLDNTHANRATFERIVFTLGRPTNPKGS